MTKNKINKVSKLPKIKSLSDKDLREIILLVKRNAEIIKKFART